MPDQTPPSDGLTLAKEAKAIAEDALAKANEAIGVAEGAEAAVAGLSRDVRRCTSEVADLKKQSACDHQETLAAIAGAASTDTKQAAAIEDTRKSISDATAKLEAASKASEEKHAADVTTLAVQVAEWKKDLAAVKGDISSAALMKITGAVAVVLVALGGVLVAITPVLPKVLEAKYAPAVVPMPAASAAPVPAPAPILPPAVSR